MNQYDHSMDGTDPDNRQLSPDWWTWAHDAAQDLQELAQMTSEEISRYTGGAGINQLRENANHAR
jgi:hypothetical protein